MVLDKPFTLTETNTDEFLQPIMHDGCWGLMCNTKHDTPRMTDILYYRSVPVIPTIGLGYLLGGDHLNDLVNKLINDKELIHAKDYFDPSSNTKHIGARGKDVYMYSGIFEYMGSNIGICLTDTGVIKVLMHLDSSYKYRDELIQRMLSAKSRLINCN